MMTFLLYNCGLELLDSIPEKALKHPAIRSDLKRRRKRPSETLLDLAVHQDAFNTKEKLNKGRPDIVHQCILQYLFSPLVHPTGNEEQEKLHLIIHTIDNNYFSVLPSWRPPVHFLRFRGLMEKLIRRRTLVVSADEEIHLNSGNVGQIINEIRPKIILLFTSHAKSKILTLHPFAELISKYYDKPDSVLCLIGGYQHGGIPAPIYSQIKESKAQIIEIALEGGRMPSWKVLSIALQGIEWNITAQG